ncbi:hypothetical protein G5714_001265 [Onychostoma macrolepis]|uniref:Uncharacterized protein n=1 Tax=Onychostoma macrolepis TaxID=369639 RepID=A0A7J6DKB0_9TELE|nr:hypothetical protein G5714_001265 [Onychostoma macrolepis]
MENRERSSSPDHSCVSLKSDGSMIIPPNFSNDPVTSDPRFFRTRKRSSSPDHSRVSLKSDGSINHPPDLSDDPVTSEPSRADGERSISGGASVFCLNNTSVTASLNKHDQPAQHSFSTVLEPLSTHPLTRPSADPELSNITPLNGCWAGHNLTYCSSLSSTEL